jgi:hypothetical protein
MMIAIKKDDEVRNYAKLCREALTIIERKFLSGRRTAEADTAMAR